MSEIDQPELPRERGRRAEGRRRPIARWVVIGVVLLVLFVVLWVSVRALIARDQLLGAVPLAQKVAASALKGDDAEVKADAAELKSRAANAAALTSDPIWRALEIVPGAGPNLTAFRQSAQMIHSVADGALPPLVRLASTLDIDAFVPKNGQIDLTTVAAAAPALSEARSAVDAAAISAEKIDTAGTIPQISSAVGQITSLIGQSSTILDGLDTAAAVLPPMLGVDGPRNYLLLSLNNAELRASGGIPGAIAVVSADDGRLSLTGSSSASALGDFGTPVLPLTEPEHTLYGEILGQYMQDVNFTPDFARSGEFAQAMWEKRTGQKVDGVVALDPIALGYLLRATGAVDAGNGVTLTSSNAAKMLLSEVYSRFAEPADQDVFFAGVTGKVFSALTSGKVNGRQLVESLAMGAEQGRIHVWSAHPDEQRRLRDTTVSQSLPPTARATSDFGVYLNDSTGAKMGYYLRARTAIASGLCRADLKPNFQVSVTLKSVAPADAATSLPEYVTGGGNYGVDPGTIGTNVYIYAPKDALAYSVKVDGVEVAFTAAHIDGHSVVAIPLPVTPGASSHVVMQFLGTRSDPTAVSLVKTPMASAMQTSVDDYLDCGAVQPRNTEVSGALGTISHPTPQ